MFQKKPDKELWRLQQELLAAEEEENEEYEEEYEPEDDLDLDAILGEEDYEPEEESEPVYANFANHYGRGSQKRFDEDLDFEEDFDDSEALTREDYRKYKKKKRRGNFGLVVLAIQELLCIGAILIWWASWML